MARALDIRIGGNNAGLTAAVNQAIAALGRVDAQAARTAGVQQREAVRTAAVQQREALRAATAAQLASERVARDAQRTANMQVREAERVAAAQERAARRAAREQERAAAQAARAAQQGFSVSAFAAGQFKDVLMGVVGQFTLLNLAQAGMQAITDMWGQWKRDSLESAKNIANVREELLELAALKGRLGDTTTENQEQLNFRSKTLQTKEAAKVFQTQFMNVSAANVDAGLINKAENEKLMVEAAKFQAAEGGSAEVHAGLAGTLPAMLGKKADGTPWTADEIMEHHRKIFNQQQKGTFEFSQGAKQLLDAQGLLGTGAFGNGPDALHQLVGVHTAISSQTSPAQAGTLLNQVIEATTGSQRKMRGPKIDQSEGDQKMSEYYSSIGAGADKHLTAPQVIEALMKDFEKEDKAGGKLAEGENLWHYLQGKGFGNQESIRGLGALYKGHKTGVTATHMRRAEMPGGLMPGEDKEPGYVAPTEMQRRFDVSPVADERRVEVGKDLSNTTQGLKTEVYQKLRQMAFWSLKARGQATGDKPEGYTESSWAVDQQKLDAEIARVMADSAKKRGVAFDPKSVYDTGFNPSRMFDYGPWASGEGRAKRFQDALSEIDTPDGRGVMAEFIEQIRPLSEAMTKAAKAIEDKRAGVSTPISIGPAKGAMRPSS